MISDSRLIPNGSELRADIVIVGAGVAGITLALELMESGARIILLESGGLEEDRETNDLNNGLSTGIPYKFGAGSRSRYLGGSSNCWGGWCGPFNPWDFEKRDWVPNSGWPIAAREMRALYPLTHKYLDLGPFDYDPKRFIQAIGRDDVYRLPLSHQDLTDCLAQFSLPTRFGLKYRNDLRSARRVELLLNANVSEIHSEPGGRRIDKLTCKTLAGNTFAVTGRFFVLATGGIENARLMLASRLTHRDGIGNEHGLVGRYFMDHPRQYGGVVRFRPGWSGNRFFDFKYHLHSKQVAALGVQVAGALMPTLNFQRRQKITNSRVWFSSRFVGDDSAAHMALAGLLERAQHPVSDSEPFSRQIKAVIGHPIDTVAYLLGRVSMSPRLTRHVKLQAIVEPDPNPASRVTLCSTEKDALGMPRAQVNWHLSSLVRRTFDRSFALVAQELQQKGIADVELDPELSGHNDWPSLDPRGTWHHMGTTRMDESARKGVVDSNCKVHSLSNLYVAGSSVFPTASANFPTQTLVALTIRLAHHIVSQLHPQDSSQLRPQHQYEEPIPAPRERAAQEPEYVTDASTNRAERTESATSDE